MEIVSNTTPDVETELRERTKSDSVYDAHFAQRLLDLLDGLRREPIGPRVYVSYFFDRELWFQYRAPSQSQCMITVTMDHLDRGPIVDGLPQFHFRMTSEVNDSTKGRKRALVEERARSVDSAVEFIQNAIRETRLLP